MNTENLQGFVEMTNDEYHAGPGVSNSHLKEIARSPLHYWEKYINPEREAQPQSSALIVGSGAHSAVLEPDLFPTEYCAAPKVDRRTKGGKAEYAAFEAENLGKTILSADEYDLCLRLRDAVHGDAAASQLLSSGIAERSAFTTESQTGELIKCRSDFLCHGHPLIVDLKTADDASPQGFARAAVNYGYYRQAPWYADILQDITGEPHHFAFVVVEKARPHAVAVYFVEPEDMDIGRRENRRLLYLIAACRAENRWPGYATEPMPLELPHWFRRQAEEAAA